MPQEYRYETKDIDGFLSQVVRYINSGHHFYFQTRVPAKKDPRAAAEKLLALYGIRKKRWQRKRRHLKKSASIHLLLCRNTILIMLSKGDHKKFYADHADRIRDIRRTALRIFGYSIRYAFSETEKRRKVSIRLDDSTRNKVKEHLLTIAVWDSYREPEHLEREIRRLPFQSYAPVYSQLMTIGRQVNRERRRRGFQQIELSCIKKNRRLGSVFAEPNTF